MTLRHISLFAFLLAGCGGTVIEPAATDSGATDTGSGTSVDVGTSEDTGIITVDAGSSGTCGGEEGSTCATGFWCSYPDGLCRAPDALGTCRKLEAFPCVAPAPGDEVCGCDGKTYASRCIATSSGQSIVNEGTCDTSTAKLCGGLADAHCGPTEYCDWGTIPSLCGGDDGTGICKPRPTSCIPTDGIYCGCDGKFYESTCAAAKAGQSVRKNGPC